MLVQIHGSEFEKLPPGAYPATFEGVVLKETKNGKCFLWTFKLTTGKTLTRFTGEPTLKATMGNRYGKWLCALAGKPTSQIAVDPDFYVGKSYTCIVGADGVLETFTPIG